MISKVLFIEVFSLFFTFPNFKIILLSGICILSLMLNVRIWIICF